MKFYDTSLAKAVTDLSGSAHILIDGQLISLVGPQDENNEAVMAIVNGLRSGRALTGVAHSACLDLSSVQSFAATMGESLQRG